MIWGYFSAWQAQSHPVLPVLEGAEGPPGGPGTHGGGGGGGAPTPAGGIGGGVAEELRSTLVDQEAAEVEVPQLECRQHSQFLPL